MESRVDDITNVSHPLNVVDPAALIDNNAENGTHAASNAAHGAPSVLDGNGAPVLGNMPNGMQPTNEVAENGNLAPGDMATGTRHLEHDASSNGDLYTEAVKRKLAVLTNLRYDDLDLTAMRFHGRALITVNDRNLRAELFRQFRQRKPESYYLNEYLTPRVNNLLNEVKGINRERKIFYSVYTFQGRIFAKISRDARGYPIDDIDDISHLIN